MIQRNEDIGTFERIALIGFGRLAQALHRAMPERISLVAARNHRSDGDPPPLQSPREVHTRLAPEGVTVVWILTRDDAIAEVARALAADPVDWRGMLVLHSSGATSSAALDPLRDCGALTAALHPNGAFTGREPVPAGLVWGLSSHDPSAVLPRVDRLLAPLSPRIVTLADRDRILYHTAATVAANGSVALFALAERLYRAAGLEWETAREVVARYMDESVERCVREGGERALTGPLVRGEQGVVAGQRNAVAERLPEESPALEGVIALVERLVELIGRRGDYQSGASSSSSAD